MVKILYQYQNTVSGLGSAITSGEFGELDAQLNLAERTASKIWERFIRNKKRKYGSKTPYRRTDWINRIQMDVFDKMRVKKRYQTRCVTVAEFI